MFRTDNNNNNNNNNNNLFVKKAAVLPGGCSFHQNGTIAPFMSFAVNVRTRFLLPLTSYG